VVTLEDLQGTLEVVVFPKTYEQTMGTWRDGAILLVAGRVDHRGDEASLLADSVWDWDEVADRGPDAFAREVGSLDKRGRRAAVGAGAGAGTRSASNGNGNGGGAAWNGKGTAAANGGGVQLGSARGPVEGTPVGPGMSPPASVASLAAAGSTVSPMRPSEGPGVAVGPGIPSQPIAPGMPIAPGEPISSDTEPPDLVTASTAAGADAREEPALPDEARAVAAAAAEAPSRPVEASAGAILNVRFSRDAGPDRVVSAMQAFKGVLRERPGATRVVVHVPAPGGSALPMELRGVAYDAELVAEVRRRVGEGIIDLQLA
jgi:hypothetical protein